jgi:hypothetical protein
MDEHNQKINYDARVVQTVRNLKKVPSKYSDTDSSASTNNLNINSSEKSEEDKYLFISNIQRFTKSKIRGQRKRTK